MLTGFAKVVGVDREISDSSGEAMIHHMSDERSVGEGDERLRQGVGEGLQSRAQSGSE